MNKLNKTSEEILAARSESKHPELMMHVVLGYPTLEKSIEIVKAMADAGAAIIELQIPFSDPIADGATIMRANEVALENKVTPADCFEAVEELSKDVSIPLLFMSYFNMVFNYKGGVADFCNDAAGIGITGLIVPDVPPEENVEGYWSETKDAGLIPVPIVSPVTNKTRLEKIAKQTKSGFVYCTSTMGTTGARSELDPGLKDYLEKVRTQFSVPLAVGFGISSREQVESLTGVADIAVVGSATIDLVAKTDPENAVAETKAFVEKLVK